MANEDATMDTTSAQTQSIVTDPTLISVLQAASIARQQCESLLQLLGSAKESAQVEADASAQRRLLVSKLATVRAVHRKSIQEMRATKAQTAEARGEVDRLHLLLQNLVYEQRHLLGEIRACESYDHKFLTLPLIPAEDYLLQNPTHETLSPHELMIARIEHELAERQALEEKRQGLLRKKQSLIAANNKRKDGLASLDRELEKFIEAAGPIEQTFERGLAPGV